jgi:DNA-binding NarL/FixJ family response regulator
MSDPHYRLVIADDHPLFRGALREAVTGLIEHADIAEAGTFEEVPKLLDKGGEVDIVLLDLAMPGVRGFSGLMFLRAQYPSVPVVVVSANDDPAVIRRCMDFGASGFIPKTLGIEQMREAIKRARRRGMDAARRRSDRWRGRRDRGADGAARNADAAAGPRPDDAVGGHAQQADRLRAVGVGGDGEGPRLGDPAEARRRQSHAGGDRRRQIELGQWPQAANQN